MEMARKFGHAPARFGLVAQLFDGQDALHLDEVVEALLQGGPRSQGAAKELIRAVAKQPVDDALVADTARRIASLRATPEAREGLAAFLDKRPAAWIARQSG